MADQLHCLFDIWLSQQLAASAPALDGRGATPPGGGNLLVLMSWLADGRKTFGVGLVSVAVLLFLSLLAVVHHMP
ncbi:hypothetical protein [Herbaspirillum sp. YR522]|uniref:hypothetical protein n=1 Tax=Herbaspirillum sp. YR522 TaxID=1144342 RepID=UPI00058C90EA|nr:hypothetical protein [Herbaspirillum sp. YR522]